MAKLLFITQKVDKDDDVLGIYHRWIEELAKKVEVLNVICLYRGRTELPTNVRVYSLGKEEGQSKLKYILRFWKYLFQLRGEYESVFVHMNPEYVIMAGWWWRLTGKKIILWYAHYLANLKLRIAAFFANKIVTSTRLAYPLESKKLTVLQQGIDTSRFAPANIKAQITNYKFRVLFLGRIAPVKDLETLLSAVKIVRQKVPGIALTIVGEPTAGKSVEIAYYEKIKKMTQDLGLQDRVSFMGRVANNKTVAIYQDHDLFVNLTTTGSFDKSTLEAMACGVPVLVSNRAFEEYFDANLQSRLMFVEGDAEDLHRKITNFISLPEAQKQQITTKLRNIIVERHGLSGLVNRLVTQF